MTAFSLVRRAAVLGCALVSVGAFAQQGATTGLYDPQPPADSAYVRAVLASGSAAYDVALDDKARAKGVKAGSMSDYLVVPAGKHRLSVSAGSQKATAELDVVASRSLTVVFMGGNAKPVVLEDKTNSNKLKAMLVAYHLDAKTGPVDVWTADGSTKVFTNIAPGASAALAVNPLNVELMFTKTGDKAPLGKVAAALTQGGAFSLILSRADAAAAQPAVQFVANKVERLSAK